MIFTFCAYLCKTLFKLEVYIDDKQLELLYTTGKSKKLKLPDQVIDKFFATVQKIEAAQSIHDLWADNGLRFKKIGKNEEYYSMRLNQKYRLELTINWENEDKTIGKFVLQTISNHYDD